MVPVLACRDFEDTSSSASSTDLNLVISGSMTSGGDWVIDGVGHEELVEGGDLEDDDDREGVGLCATTTLGAHDGTIGKFLCGGAGRAAGTGSVVGRTSGWGAAKTLLEFFLDFHPALAACERMARVDFDGCGSPKVMKFSWP